MQKELFGGYVCLASDVVMARIMSTPGCGMLSSLCQVSVSAWSAPEVLNESAGVPAAVRRVPGPKTSPEQMCCFAFQVGRA